MEEGEGGRDTGKDVGWKREGMRKGMRGGVVRGRREMYEGDGRRNCMVG